MDTNRKILIGAIGVSVVAGGIAIGLILSRTPEKASLSTIHTETAAEPSKETMAPSTSFETESTKESATENSPVSSGVTASIETYVSGAVSIQYPVVSQMEDKEKEDQVNLLLKTNALSFLKANQINEETDAVSVKCQIIAVDRKRLTAVYTGSSNVSGAAYPSSLFFTNTVDLLQVQNMGFGDFTDAYTMAGYVLSEDVRFSGISADVEAAVLDYRQNYDIETLTSLFDKADFPLSSETEWPESFSYEKQGTIYFSLPVPHALGDYVIVAFDPSTK